MPPPVGQGIRWIGVALHQPGPGRNRPDEGLAGRWPGRPGTWENFPVGRTGLETAKERMRPMDVALVGTGLMGEPLAGRLLEAGHRVTVWNRSPEKTRALAERGAAVADYPHEAIAG
ncbi:MAG TPA: NAD(P)-binding domain-containing protein, partial [Gammaproteobacteria bacterium]|nr:NAD(P)-binding domain-containing protein [Gammaproteobacteria bacterium]